MICGLPVPIVKKDGGWFFDTAVGKDELLNRRIGKERAFHPARHARLRGRQREYASADRDGSEVLKYAQRLVSSPGKHDGLYGRPSPTEDESPLGPLVAFAQVEGYSPELREEDEAERGPYHGYYFKILTRQGKHASGGKYNYVINGNMIGGSRWSPGPLTTGLRIMSFVVNQRGRVYRKRPWPEYLEDGAENERSTIRIRRGKCPRINAPGLQVRTGVIGNKQTGVMGYSSGHNVLKSITPMEEIVRFVMLAQIAIYDLPITIVFRLLCELSALHCG
jgi:hypothetical protein